MLCCFKGSRHQTKVDEEDDTEELLNESSYANCKLASESAAALQRNVDFNTVLEQVLNDQVVVKVEASPKVWRHTDGESAKQTEFKWQHKDSNIDVGATETPRKSESSPLEVATSSHDASSSSMPSMQPADMAAVPSLEQHVSVLHAEQAAIAVAAVDLLDTSTTGMGVDTIHVQPPSALEQGHAPATSGMPLDPHKPEAPAPGMPMLKIQTPVQETANTMLLSPEQRRAFPPIVTTHQYDTMHHGMQSPSPLHRVLAECGVSVVPSPMSMAAAILTGGLRTQSSGHAKHVPPSPALAGAYPAATPQLVAPAPVPAPAPQAFMNPGVGTPTDSAAAPSPVVELQTLAGTVTQNQTSHVPPAIASEPQVPREAPTWIQPSAAPLAAPLTTPTSALPHPAPVPVSAPAPALALAPAIQGDLDTSAACAAAAGTTAAVHEDQPADTCLEAATVPVQQHGQQQQQQQQHLEEERKVEDRPHAPVLAVPVLTAWPEDEVLPAEPHDAPGAQSVMLLAQPEAAHSPVPDAAAGVQDSSEDAGCSPAADGPVQPAHQLPDDLFTSQLQASSAAAEPQSPLAALATPSPSSCASPADRGGPHTPTSASSPPPMPLPAEPSSTSVDRVSGGSNSHQQSRHIKQLRRMILGTPKSGGLQGPVSGKPSSSSSAPRQARSEWYAQQELRSGGLVHSPTGSATSSAVSSGNGRRAKAGVAEGSAPRSAGSGGRLKTASVGGNPFFSIGPGMSQTYSSASSRMALQGMFSYHNKRSASSVSSVDKLKENVDFRPKWRY